MLDEGKDVNVLPWQVECGIAATLDQTKASDLYYRFKFLLGYLEAHQDNNTKPIQTFIDTIQQDVEARQHWPISTEEEVGSVFPLLQEYLIVSTSSSVFGTHFRMPSIHSNSKVKPTVSRDQSIKFSTFHGPETYQLRSR